MNSKFLNHFILFFILSTYLHGQESLPYESKIADLGEIQIEYMDYGGEGITFIWVQDMHNYYEGRYENDIMDPFLEELTKYARVIVPLRRGYGKSTNTNGWGYDVGTQSEDLLDFMDALNIEKAVLFGRQPANQDMIWIAEHHPERLAGLVFEGNPILIVGSSYSDEILFLENRSASAKDFKVEIQKRLVMSRAFWRPHFLKDQDARINIPALRIMNTDFENISVMRRTADPERMRQFIQEDYPGSEKEMKVLKELVLDSLRFEKLQAHLEDSDSSKDLDEGMERFFGEHLKTVEKKIDFSIPDGFQNYLTWMFVEIQSFLSQIKD